MVFYYGPTQGVTWIPWVEFWFNTTFHDSVGTMPFEVVKRELMDKDEAETIEEAYVEGTRQNGGLG